ncbi:MAG: hypothetical protein MUF71_16050 [Candidatus Kapabacteria bacterium]|jgi:hypothetical protein|nr:hypothetical protein [Candidatus Kapabacteria bacterium]
MNAFAVQIPSIAENQHVEISVNVNGATLDFHYRVEFFTLRDYGFPNVSRANCIRNILAEYDANWDTYQVSAVDEDRIAITFRKKRE